MYDQDKLNKIEISYNEYNKENPRHNTFNDVADFDEK